MLLRHNGYGACLFRTCEAKEPMAESEFDEALYDCASLTDIALTRTVRRIDDLFGVMR